MTLASRQTMTDMLGEVQTVDLNAPIMALRIVKSAEEIAHIKGGANTARLRTENIMRILMLSPWNGNQHGQSHGTQGKRSSQTPA